VIFKEIATGKHFVVQYEKGLTENQEDLYSDQEAVEVHQITETVVVKKWVTVG
jgi:hypothetical protein